jgi:hypothetical protein
MQEKRKQEDRKIAQAIFEFERQKLLDFRKSLYMAISVLAPVVNEDEETLETKKPSEQVRVKEITHEQGAHTYHLELTDSKFLTKPYSFLLTIPPDDEVQLEEEAQDNE